MEVTSFRTKSNFVLVIRFVLNNSNIFSFLLISGLLLGLIHGFSWSFTEIGFVFYRTGFVINLK